MCLAKFCRESDDACSVVCVCRRREGEGRLTVCLRLQTGHICLGGGGRRGDRVVCGARGIDASEKSGGERRSESVPRNVCREPPFNFRRGTCEKEWNNASTFFVLHHLSLLLSLREPSRSSLSLRSRSLSLLLLPLRRSSSYRELLLSSSLLELFLSSS